VSDKPRTVKTAAQRAQEAVDVLERRLGKVKQAKALLERQARELNPEIDAISKRLEYAKSNPDLDLPAKEEATS